MKFLDKLIKSFDSLITSLTISLLLVLMMFGTYALYDVYKVYDSAKLDDEVVTLGPQSSGEKFSLSNLKKINKDIIGWVVIDDTNINYPILKSHDNTDYLTTNYKGEYAAAGSIFLDYRSNDLKDDYSIIYGHNMNANLMFGDIKSYKDEMFFKHHLEGKLYVEDKAYRLDVLAYAMASAYDNHIYDIETYKNGRNFEVINKFKSIATFENGLDEYKDSKLLLLSTCDASGVNERSVLIAKLTELSVKEVKEVAKKDKEILKQEEKLRQKEKEESKYFDIWDMAFIVLLIIVILIYVILLVIKKSNKKKKKKTTTKNTNRRSEKKFKFEEDEEIEFIDLKKK